MNGGVRRKPIGATSCKLTNSATIEASCTQMSGEGGGNHWSRGVYEDLGRDDPWNPGSLLAGTEDDPWRGG